MNNNEIVLNPKAFLESVVFARKKDYNGPLKIITQDSFKDIKVKENVLSFYYVRHVALSPEALFDVTVTFSYEAKIINEAMIYFKNIEQIDKKILVNLVNKTVLPQYASTIIANITSVNKSNPLVTIPVCLAQ